MAPQDTDIFRVLEVPEDSEMEKVDMVEVMVVDVADGR